MMLETATALVCMSYAIYFEARSEPIVAQLAVAQVVMNEVVTDGLRYSWDSRKIVRDQCAFSFYCDGKPEVIDDVRAYDWAEAIAWSVLEGEIYIDVTDGSTHYHANYVSPYWADAFTQTVCINTHCFYRWEH